MRTIYSTSIPGAETITLFQNAGGSFRVVYGLAKYTFLTYEEAAHEIGECLMHALMCAGLVDGEDT